MSRANQSAERELLGALLVAPRTVTSVLTEVHLRPEHFAFERHRHVMAAVVSLADKLQPVDEISVADELERSGVLADAGGAEYLAELAANVSAPGHALHYARLVSEEHGWRQKALAAELIREGVEKRDREKLAEAEALLASGQSEQGDFTPYDLQVRALEMLEQGGVDGHEWPLRKLNDLSYGGVRPGEFVVIGGHSSHGKSQFLDQSLEHFHRRGLKCHLYINEMSVDERIGRVLTRKSGVPYRSVITGASQEEVNAATRAIGDGFPFGITAAAGWSATEIAHHIRRHRWDVAAVDILHLIPHREERDLAQISATFARAARQANCVLIATAHLNEGRVMHAVRPKPTLGDIRGSGSIKNDADTVCFVWREQHDQTGIPEPEGAIWFAKVRNGETGGLPVRFDSSRLRFVPLVGATA